MSGVVSSPSDRRLGWPGFSLSLCRAQGAAKPTCDADHLAFVSFHAYPQREARSVCGVQGTFMGQSWEQVCLESSNGGSKITELDFGREQARRTELPYFVKYDAERNRDFMDGCIFQTTHTQQHTQTNTHTHTPSSCIRGRGHARLNAVEESSGTTE